jgi:putative transposase
VAARNRQSQARFAGVACATDNNADVVGAIYVAINMAINVAIDVLARGHRVAAGAQDGSGRGRKTSTKRASTKQEPTEATVREGLMCSTVGIPASGRGGGQAVK